LEITDHVSQWLNELPAGTTSTVGAIARGAEIHWLTASSYLRLFEYVHEMLPSIHVTSDTVQILHLSRAAERLQTADPEAHLLSRILRGVNRRKKPHVSSLEQPFSPEELSLTQDDFGMFGSLLEAGMIRSAGKKWYLTREGMKVANDAIQRYFVPHENLLSGGVVLEPGLAELKVKVKEEKQERAVAFDKLNARISEIERRETQLSKTEELIKRSLRISSASVKPLAQFIEERLAKLKHEFDLSAVAEDQGMSASLLAQLIGLQSALSSEQPDFSLLVVTNPTGAKAEHQRKDGDDSIAEALRRELLEHA